MIDLWRALISSFQGLAPSPARINILVDSGQLHPVQAYYFLVFSFLVTFKLSEVVLHASMRGLTSCITSQEQNLGTQLYTSDFVQYMSSLHTVAFGS